MAGHRVTARRTQQHKSTSPSPSPRALRHAVAHRRVSASLSGTPSGPAPAHVQSKRPAKARRLCGEAKRSHHPASSHHNPGWMGRRRAPRGVRTCLCRRVPLAHATSPPLAPRSSPFSASCLRARETPANPLSAPALLARRLPQSHQPRPPRLLRQAARKERAEEAELLQGASDRHLWQPLCALQRRGLAGGWGRELLAERRAPPQQQPRRLSRPRRCARLHPRRHSAPPATGRVRAAVFVPTTSTTIQFHAEQQKKSAPCSGRASSVHALQMFSPEDTKTLLDDAKRIGSSIGWVDRGVSLPTQGATPLGPFREPSESLPRAVRSASPRAARRALSENRERALSRPALPAPVPDAPLAAAAPHPASTRLLQTSLCKT